MVIQGCWSLFPSPPFPSLTRLNFSVLLRKIKLKFIKKKNTEEGGSLRLPPTLSLLSPPDTPTRRPEATSWSIIQSSEPRVPQYSAGSIPAPAVPMEAILCRSWNACFRNFRAEGLHPLKHLSTLQGLCRNWLRPDLRSKEQILDQLVMEQFLISSTPELQALVLKVGVQTCAEMEHLLRNLEAPRDHSAPQNWVSEEEVEVVLGGGCWEESGSVQNVCCQERLLACLFVGGNLGRL